MTERAAEKPLWREHLGLVITGVALASTAYRMLYLAGWDPLTATAVVQRSGSVNLTIASAVALVPNGIGIALVALTMVMVRRRRDDESVDVVWWATWTVLGLLTAFISSVITVLVVMTAILVSAGVRRYRTKRPRKAPSGAASTFPADSPHYYVFVATLRVMTISSYPLLASEAVKISDENPVMGYVLNEANDQVSVLLVHPRHREVRTLPKGSVEHEICDSSREPWYLRRLGDFTGGDSPYVKCPR